MHPFHEQIKFSQFLSYLCGPSSIMSEPWIAFFLVMRSFFSSVRDYWRSKMNACSKWFRKQFRITLAEENSEQQLKQYNLLSGVSEFQYMPRFSEFEYINNKSVSLIELETGIMFAHKVGPVQAAVMQIFSNYWERNYFHRGEMVIQVQCSFDLWLLWLACQQKSYQVWWHYYMLNPEGLEPWVTLSMWNPTVLCKFVLPSSECLQDWSLRTQSFVF